MEFFRVFLKKQINERLICYTLNVQEAISIDPDPNTYFINKNEAQTVLEVSEYFVTQIQKEHLENEALLDAAFELQKEALWNRCKLGDTLYVRQFVEDNSPVTQLWRPIIPGFAKA